MAAAHAADLLVIAAELGDGAEDDGVDAEDAADFGGAGGIGAVTVVKVLFGDDLVESGALDDVRAAARVNDGGTGDVRHGAATLLDQVRRGEPADLAIVGDDAVAPHVGMVVAVDHHEADAVAAQAVDRNDHFGAKLVVLPGPDEPGLDGARGLAALAAIERRRQGHLDQRDHVANRPRQSDVRHVLLQVREAVFESEAVVDIVGVRHAGGRCLGRKVEAEIADNGEGPQKGQRPRDVAEALAEIEDNGAQSCKDETGCSEQFRSVFRPVQVFPPNLFLHCALPFLLS